VNNLHRFGGDVSWIAAAWKIKKEVSLRDIIVLRGHELDRTGSALCLVLWVQRLSY
jgi:hypothetical protein